MKIYNKNVHILKKMEEIPYYTKRYKKCYEHIAAKPPSHKKQRSYKVWWEK
jgi:hypothetical protein